MLGETAKEIIRQRDFWYVVPEPEDAALALLARSVHDTTREVFDSDSYDGGILDSLLQFKPFLKRSAKVLNCVV